MQISWNEHKRVAQQHIQSAENTARRTAAIVDENFNDMVDKNITLLKENRKLKEENERAVELIRKLADSRESFRRVAAHLRQAWANEEPIPETLKESGAEILGEKKREIESDPEWSERREELIKSELTPPPPKSRSNRKP